MRKKNSFFLLTFLFLYLYNSLKTIHICQAESLINWLNIDVIVSFDIIVWFLIKFNLIHGLCFVTIDNGFENLIVIESNWHIRLVVTRRRKIVNEKKKKNSQLK